MKAYVLHAVGDLRYEDIPMPECPSPDWAIVKIKAAGICSSDIPRVFSKGTYHFPTIPGHELAGIVHRVGDEANASWVGRRVGIFPLIPCRRCVQCAEKHYEMCEHYDYVGSRRDGGWAEYVAVPIWNLIALPDDFSFRAAAMLEPLAVALHAIKCGRLQQGADVAIIGTGMIGISAAQWAKLMGAKSVTVIGRHEDKRALVEGCGVSYATTINRTYPFVLEAVGSESAVNDAIKATAPAGSLVLMGNPAGNIQLQQDVYWRILRKQLSINGTWNSSYDGPNASDWTEAVEAIANGKVSVESLISHVFSQEELPRGLELMAEHRQPYCKIMTIWND